MSRRHLHTCHILDFIKNGNLSDLEEVSNADEKEFDNLGYNTFGIL